MNDPTPDIPRLRKVLEHITAHPEEHVQDAWAIRYIEDGEPFSEYCAPIRQFLESARQKGCGTAMCVAGHVVHQAGYDIDWNSGYLTEWCRKSGDSRGISPVAQELLGLDSKSARELFRCSNTLEDLWRIAREIAERAGEQL